MPRFSPSHSLQPLHDLTLMVPWAHAKVLGKNTFPSDHTVVLWTAATFIVYYTGRRFGPIAVVLATIACMPRLVAGAHWLSDMVVGGAAVILISMSIALATPIQKTVVAWMRRMLSRMPKIEALLLKLV